MNVYEESHKLAKAIKESEEYKQLKTLSEKIEEKNELKSMLKDFMEKQVEMQTKQMLGEEISTYALEDIQKL